MIENYNYDLVGNLQSKTDRKNQTIQYVYDALYRVTSKTYPDTTSVEYAYDLAGKVQQVSDPTGTYGFAYDNMGRLIGTTTQYSYLPGFNFQNAYTYDAASNRKSLTAPDGSVSTYGYDTLNRLNGLANSWAGSFGFSYDALNRRTQLTRPNGITTNYNYDSLSHLLSVLHQAGTTTLDGASYTYDPAGNRISKGNYLNGVTSNYTYDPLYELTQVTQRGSTTETYSYDVVGNRLSSSGVPNYNYNLSNEMTSNSSGSYTYDANGNTLSDASGKSYTWDFENRLAQAVVPGTSGGTTSFKYDPFGRRIQKSGPLGTTNYLYDGTNSIEEVNSGGNVSAKYSQSPVVDEDLAMFRSGVASYYHSDGLGSITSLSNAAGALANTYTYDSFGRLIASTGPLVNPFQYTAREFDPETNLYNYRARYYDGVTARFLSEDQMGFDIGSNFYHYVGNNPVNLVDRFGLAASKPCVDTNKLGKCLSAQFHVDLASFSPTIGTGGNDPGNVDGSATVFIEDSLSGIVGYVTIINNITNKGEADIPRNLGKYGYVPAGNIDGWTKDNSPYINFTLNGVLGQAAMDTQIQELGNSISNIMGIMPGKLPSPYSDPGAQLLRCYMQAVGRENDYDLTP